MDSVIVGPDRCVKSLRVGRRQRRAALEGTSGAPQGTASVAMAPRLLSDARHRHPPDVLDTRVERAGP